MNPVLAPRRATNLAKIEMLALDVDGVLTDGRLYFGARGEIQKVFHVRDGHGIRLLLGAGVRIVVISGRRSPAVAARMRELQADALVQGCVDKVAALEKIARKFNVPLRYCACMVDDTLDMPLMAACGFSAAVADAHPLVLRAADWVAAERGGNGAVRELSDALLRAKSRVR